MSTVTIAFTVPDAQAERMRHSAVYLDVYGNVRWEASGNVVAGSSRWDEVQARSDASS